MPARVYAPIARPEGARTAKLCVAQNEDRWAVTLADHPLERTFRDFPDVDAALAAVAGLGEVYTLPQGLGSRTWYYVDQRHLALATYVFLDGGDLEEIARPRFQRRHTFDAAYPHTPYQRVHYHCVRNQRRAVHVQTDGYDPDAVEARHDARVAEILSDLDGVESVWREHEILFPFSAALFAPSRPARPRKPRTASVPRSRGPFAPAPLGIGDFVRRESSQVVGQVWSKAQHPHDWFVVWPGRTYSTMHVIRPRPGEVGEVSATIDGERVVRCSEDGRELPDPAA